MIHVQSHVRINVQLTFFRISFNILNPERVSPSSSHLVLETVFPLIPLSKEIEQKNLDYKVDSRVLVDFGHKRHNCYNHAATQLI